MAYITRFRESEQEITAECSFKEFINCPFFDQNSKQIISKSDHARTFFIGENDKLVIQEETEMFDFWELVKFYHNGSKRPQKEMTIEYIESVKLILNPESDFDIKGQLEFNESIRFNLTAGQTEALLAAYKDNDPDYFPGLVH